MTGTSDDEEGKWKNRSTTLRRLGRQYSPDVTPEVASRRLKQWIVGNPVLLGLLHENGWTASRRGWNRLCGSLGNLENRI